VTFDCQFYSLRTLTNSRRRYLDVSRYSAASRVDLGIGTR